MSSMDGPAVRLLVADLDGHERRRRHARVRGQFGAELREAAHRHVQPLAARARGPVRPVAPCVVRLAGVAGAQLQAHVAPHAGPHLPLHHAPVRQVVGVEGLAHVGALLVQVLLQRPERAGVGGADDGLAVGRDADGGQVGGLQLRHDAADAVRVEAEEPPARAGADQQPVADQPQAEDEHPVEAHHPHGALAGRDAVDAVRRGRRALCAGRGRQGAVLAGRGILAAAGVLRLVRLPLGRAGVEDALGADGQAVDLVLRGVVDDGGLALAGTR